MPILRALAGGLKVRATMAICLAAASVLYPAVGQTQDASTASVETAEGNLGDGTPYLVRKPVNWNGIVVIDLDGRARRDDGVYQLLLKAGYGTAGADRRLWDRDWTLNRNDDARRPQEALAIFKAKFGKPKLVIVFGRSAGGAMSLLTSEHRPDTIDGAVPLCATMPFGYAHYNLIFEFFYTLKALMAPNDASLVTHALPPRDYQPIIDRWEQLLQAAAKTPEGRARIALAHTISQYPVYASVGVNQGVRKPDFNDPKAVADAMAEQIPDLVKRLKHLIVYDDTDFPADLAIPGTAQPDVVGNDGAVYLDYWKNSDPTYVRVTEALYAKAGVSLASDLKTLDAAPRVVIDRSLLGAQGGLIGRGLPTMPVFRMDNLGDLSAPPNVSMLYDALVAGNGLDHLYRTAYVDNSRHCKFKPEQEFAAIEVMRERLQTGKWPAVDAASLNARAGRNDGDGVIFVERKFGPYTGTWRLMEYPNAYRPATFASAAALVNSHEYTLTSEQRQQLLTSLSAAESAVARGKTAEANAALDRFAETVKSISNAVTRTRLLATAFQLRAKD